MLIIDGRYLSERKIKLLREKYEYSLKVGDYRAAQSALSEIGFEFLFNMEREENAAK